MKVFLEKVQFVVPRRLSLYGEEGVFVSRKRTIFSRNGRGFNFPKGFNIGKEIEGGAWYQVSISTFFPEKVKVFFISGKEVKVLSPLFTQKVGKKGKTLSRFVLCRTTPERGAVRGYIATLSSNGIRGINLWRISLSFSGGEVILQRERIYSSLVSQSVPALPEEVLVFQPQLEEWLNG